MVPVSGRNGTEFMEEKVGEKKERVDLKEVQGRGKARRGREGV